MELSHTLEVRPNLFIRSFVKFYGLSKPYDLNTCKLFWGTIGMVVLPILLLALSPLIAIVVPLGFAADKVKESNTRRRIEARNAPPAPPSRAKRTRADFLTKLSMWGSAFWFKVQTPVTWLFRIVAGAVILAVVVAVILLVIQGIGAISWGAVLPVVGYLLIVAAVLLAIGFFLGRPFLKWLESRPTKPAKTKKPSVIKAVFNSIHDHTCANIKVADSE